MNHSKRDEKLKNNDAPNGNSVSNNQSNEEESLIIPNNVLFLSDENFEVPEEGNVQEHEHHTAIIPENNNKNEDLIENLNQSEKIKNILTNNVKEIKNQKINDNEKNEIPHTKLITIESSIQAIKKGDNGNEKDSKISEFNSEISKNALILDSMQNKNEMIIKEIEMKNIENNNNSNNEVNLLVSAPKNNANSNENQDKEKDPILNKKNIVQYKSLMKGNSSYKNKMFFLNEDITKDLPQKNKKTVQELFERLDLDFIKDKKNKKNFNFNDRYYKQLQLEAEKLHPREKMQIIPVCKSSTGCMGCCEKYENSDLMQTGLGMVIYFKILKTFGIIFFLICLFNLLLFYVFTSSHKELEVKSYQDALFKTTIGNIGSTLYKCERYNLTSANKYFLYNYRLDLDCGEQYTISSVVSMGGTIDTAKDSINQANCIPYSNKMSIYTDHCNVLPYFDKKISESNCKGKNNCSVNIDLEEIYKNCTQNIFFDNLYSAYSCFDPLIRIQLGNKEFSIDRTNFSFITVGIDLASMITLFISLFFISKSQTTTEEKFREDYLKISNFTLHFANLELKGDNFYEELNLFQSHIKSVYDKQIEIKLDKIKNGLNLSDININREEEAKKLEKEMKNRESIIYDINYTLVNQNKLDIILEKNNLFGERMKLEYQAEKVKEQNKDDFNKINSDIFKLKKKENDLDQKYLANKNNFTKIDDIYITFYNSEDCEIIRQAYDRSKFSRCCTIFCCNRKKIQYLYFKNQKWLNVKKNIDEPSNILWENMQYSPLKRIIRKFIAILFSIILIIASIALVMAAKYGENQIAKSFNTAVDCKFVDNKGEEDLRQEILGGVTKNNRIVANCFCMDLLISKQIAGVQDFSMIVNNVKIYPCIEWLNLWLQSQSLKIGIIVLVPIINIILSIALEFFTTFEKSKSLSNVLISTMTKSYILQLFNTGIVIVLVNANVKAVQDWWADFPFFTGRYSDFDPGWYSDVGSTILFYMILNIVTPHIAPLIGFLLTNIKRCFDRCCASNKISSKVTKNEYFELYVGPEFSMGSRYAQILSTIFVVIIFSSGIPILYLCCFLFFFVTFWIDKFMVLRFYRTPPHTDLYISKLFNTIVLFGIIVHICVGIWIYGNKEIFVNVNSSFLDFLSNYLNNNVNFGTSDGLTVGIKERLLMPHNLLMTIFLVLIVLWFIYKYILKNLFRIICCVRFCNCSCKCGKTKKAKTIELLDRMPLSSLYFNHQLHKSQYIKYLLSRKDDDETDFEKKFFKIGLQKTREEFAKRLKLNLNDSNQSNDLEDQVAMQLISKESEEDRNDIIGDRSYNMADHYQFRHLIYFEYFAAFLKRKESNDGDVKNN